MKLGYVILYVENVKETVDFYNKAFNLECQVIGDCDTYGECKSGGTTLAFVSEKYVTEQGIPIRTNRVNQQPAAFEICFGAESNDDVKKTYEYAIANGAKSITEPQEMPWGFAAYVFDNNGVIVQFCTNEKK